MHSTRSVPFPFHGTSTWIALPGTTTVVVAPFVWSTRLFRTTATPSRCVGRSGFGEIHTLSLFDDILSILLARPSSRCASCTSRIPMLCIRIIRYTLFHLLSDPSVPAPPKPFILKVATRTVGFPVFLALALLARRFPPALFVSGRASLLILTGSCCLGSCASSLECISGVLVPAPSWGASRPRLGVVSLDPPASSAFASTGGLDALLSNSSRLSLNELAAGTLARSRARAGASSMPMSRCRGCCSSCLCISLLVVVAIDDSLPDVQNL